jgi:DHA1 family tetracycline resistance protein-like MFS transporter
MKYWISLFTLLMVILIDSMGYSILVPILAPILLDEKPIMMADQSPGARFLVYGLALGVYDLVMMYLAPVLGTISDQIGRKKVLIISLMGLILSYLMLVAATTANIVVLLLLARILGGATAGAQAVAQAAVVDMSTPKNKGLLLSMCLLFSSGGFILGPALGAILMNENLVEWFNYTTPLYAVAAAAGLGLFLMLAFYHETREVPGKLDRKSLNFSAGARCLMEGWRHPRIRRLAIIFTFHQLSWGAYFLFMPSLLIHRFDFDDTRVATFLSVMGIGFCIAYGIVNPLLSRWLKPRAISHIGIWSTLALLGYTLTIQDSVHVWWVAIPIGCLVSVAYGAIIQMFSDSVEVEKQGWALGITISVTAIGFGVISVVSGAISAWHYSAPIVMSVGLMAISGICLLMLPKESKS